MSDRGWLIWFIGFVGTFGFFEGRALATHQPEKTLSYAIWRMVNLRSGQPIYQWTFGHFAFMILLFGLFVWLFFHFNLGWWR